MFQKFWKYYDVININFCKVFIWAKNSINLFLNVSRRIAKTYYDDIKAFLFSMRDNNEFMTFRWMNSSLIKKFEAVDDEYERTFIDCLNYIRLKKYEICIWLRNRIQFAYIYHHTIFSNFWRVSSNYETEKTERCSIRCS